MRNHPHLIALVTFLTLPLICPRVVSAGATVVYVDIDATGASDGSSWDNAFNDLQEALAVSIGSAVEIRVAEGTYKPTQGTDRNATFWLRNNLTIRGGFAGVGHPDPDDRNITLYETVLSGDLNGDDGPHFARNFENSFNVVTADQTDSTSILDGLTISGGSGNRGAGLMMLGASPMVIDCTFSGNEASSQGGGAYALGELIIDEQVVYVPTAPTFIRCIFENNRAIFGGGLRLTLASATLIDCTFENNVATVDGGGVDFHTGSIDATLAKLINCSFVGNHAVSNGGGLYSTATESRLTNCAFSGNTAGFRGGAIHAGAIFYAPDYFTLTNCTVANNHADDFTGGIFASSAQGLKLTNSILWGNTHQTGSSGQDAQIFNGSPIMNYSCVQGWTGDLGGVGNFGNDPRLVDVAGPDTEPGSADDNLRLRPGSPCIDAGDNDALPQDEFDLDGDGDIAEPLPMDADHDMRIRDDPQTPDTGSPPGASAIVDLGAYEDPKQAFVVSTSLLEVPEGGSAGFTVALEGKPQGSTTVAVYKESGDDDIVVSSGSLLSFNPGNYMIPQTVELSAAQDADFTSDEALIWITSPEIFTAGLVAREIDDDPVPAIVHVDENSGGIQTGYAWATAYRSLSDALRAAEENPAVQQIWVAKGSYPTAQSGEPRESTFKVRNDLALYGGFVGDETSVEHRNPSLNETVLTGDIDQDDPEFSDCCIGNGSPSCDESICNSTICAVDPFCCDATWDQICATMARTLCSNVCGRRSDNSFHVVTASDTDSTAILDGFTVTGGYADEFANKNKNGAGLFMVNGSPTINGCMFKHNIASFGGGIYSFDGSRPHITNCQFVQNASDNGGGFVSGDESVPSANPTLVNCLFNGNYATGAAVDSITLGNGGAVWIKGSGTFTNCTFHSNRGITTGGVWNEFGIELLGLTNSILWGNSRLGVVDEDAQLDSFVGTIAVNYSAVQGWTGQHGGIGNVGDDPQFTDPFGDDGMSGTSDDNLRLTTGSPYIDNGDSLALPSEITTDLDGRQRIVDGDLDGEAIVDRGAYELLPPAGRVPDGANLPGTPLTLGKVGGAQLALSWGLSCLSGDTDYEVYEGSLGDFTSHVPRFCSTSGVSGMTFDAPAGDVYYLIVPTNDIAEGSYGVDHQGNGRLQGLSACFPQSIDGCP